MATTCLHWVRIFEMNLVNKWLVNYFFRDSNPLYSRKIGLSFGTDSFSCLFEENTFLGAQSKHFGNFYCWAELNFPHSFFCCHCTPPLHVSWHKLAVRGICGHKTIFSSVVKFLETPPDLAQLYVIFSLSVTNEKVFWCITKSFKCLLLELKNKFKTFKFFEPRKVVK